MVHQPGCVRKKRGVRCPVEKSGVPGQLISRARKHMDGTPEGKGTEPQAMRCDVMGEHEGALFIQVSKNCRDEENRSGLEIFDNYHLAI